MTRFWCGLALACLASIGPAQGATPAASPSDPLNGYFRAETELLATSAFGGIESREDWETWRPRLREQLLDMLGLWPLPERTDLKPVVTGTLEKDGVVVEKLHFQSMPGLYVTANLYRPAQVTNRLPAVLYVCGHAQVKTNGLSCGNKTGYQHHGHWFARHGYVALLIDTLQLGEIEGVHHGTHRLGQWWWNSRGYTPAGVEAWNGIRALDYLESRPDIDPSRMGMTGRSGGGSYTWTTAAVDERVKVAAPVAGITDLRNQVVDGVIEGHCDCMFFVNSHRWDFGLNAALLAPRPLLMVNTDHDTIFPLDGVQRVHAQVRRIYDLLGATDRLGLAIGPGPHQDTQDLQVPVFRWFGKHLKGEATVVSEPAVKAFDPLALRVFGKELPADERNTRAAEWFPDRVDRRELTWTGDGWKDVLVRMRIRVFGGWPQEASTPPRIEPGPEAALDGREIRQGRIETQPGIVVPLLTIRRVDQTPRRIVVHVLADSDWPAWRPDGEPAVGAGAQAAWDADVAQPGGAEGLVTVGVLPRGTGVPTSIPGTAEARRDVQIRRRFMLLGQTLDGMRVWDIRQGIRALRQTYGDEASIEVHAEGGAALNALLAALHEPGIVSVRLRDLPATLRAGPDYLNLLQFGDVPWLRRLAAARGLRVEEPGR